MVDIGGRSKGGDTHEDLPGDFHPYYGQKLNRYRDKTRKIAKIDIDADLNMDGVIRQGDPQDGGAFETTPPGLILGVGEMTKIVMTVIPYRVDFQGDVVVGLEVSGINRASETGVFSSFADEQKSVAHVRVWRDAERKELLLDSADPDKRLKEFSISSNRYPANLPSAIPRTVYVEGVKAAGKYLGDLRLLATVSHRDQGEQKQAQGAAAPSPPLKLFRTSFDHILITVSEKPAKKEFVNNNSEGVWIELPKKSDTK